MVQDSKNSSAPRKRPLDGIRVLDLSRVLAGPWCTQNLADLGAEVFKIERPGTGDDTRTWGPPFLRDAGGRDTSESAYFLCANRNKQSVAIDMSSPEGAALIREFAKSCDVVVENFKVGGLKKYGLDYESLSALNPRLVHCSVTGFGQSGPLSQRAGYDFLIQGMGGLMSITGEPDSVAGGGPEKVGVAVTDLMAGMYATTGILAALMEREKSGLGQHLDIALLDCQLAMLANQSMNYLTTGVAPRRMGNAHPNIVPYQTFAASDGHVIVACGNDGQFRALCTAMNVPELAIDSRFATNSGRSVNRAELLPQLAAVFATRTRDAWVEALEACGVPCGPINDIEQAFGSEQAVHRGAAREIAHPVAGVAPTVASPLRLSATPVQYDHAPPMLGEHTNAVLREVLGLDDAKISELVQAGVIGA
ncbi:L-carnitine dehydratase/bile acid-inducible protein F [Caballeronia sordidicola]|uniref:L-carnitine dehydratase/bile acid-inducible protein F n=1 Tax=Caballeronia sordidicola TaxID=196367 RepID=A0A158I2A5_CABSO|nr:CaiB/BaiF CoA-transferase family protein [Caballeronia sordidicola]SAL50676.1 L-carnitine dehydratase/bile acid-inducible protein F [Caballeronia sordidicola]